jgi:hypothetical protein
LFDFSQVQLVTFVLVLGLRLFNFGLHYKMKEEKDIKTKPPKLERGSLEFPT